MQHILKLCMILLSCANCALTPPNVKVCGRLTLGAACSYTLSGERSRMTEEEFRRIEFGLIFFPDPAGWGEIRKFIIKSCRRSESCDLADLEERLALVESGIDLSALSALSRKPVE